MITDAWWSGIWRNGRKKEEVEEEVYKEGKKKEKKEKKEFEEEADEKKEQRRTTVKYRVADLLKQESNPFTHNLALISARYHTGH